MYGLRIPNKLNGYIGTGSDYQLAMYIGAMFMAGWTVLLAWGAIKTIERRDLLLIASGFLFLTVIIELVFFSSMLVETGFIFGVTKRMFLGVLATAVYFYSFKNKRSQYSS